MPTHPRSGYVRTDGVAVRQTTVRTRGSKAAPAPEAMGDLRAAADAVAGSPPAPRQVEALQCAGCQEYFASPGGPVYVCSRCEGVQVEDNRCEICGVLMRRVAEESCPECQDDSVLVRTGAWEADGRLFGSSTAAVEWIEGAEEREAEAARLASRLEARRADADRRLNERIREMLPRARALRERLDPALAPKLCDDLDYSIENMERQEAPFNVVLRFSELANTVLPDDAEAVAAAVDRRAPHEQREPRIAAVREKLLERIDHPELRDRIDTDFEPGVGLEVSAEVATDAILATMVGVAARGEADAQHPTKIVSGGLVRWMAHCSRCGAYEDDADSQPPADFLCEACTEATETAG